MPSLSNTPKFQCAAGVYCQLPFVDCAESCHKCFFYKGTLHGPCGVLHVPDNIIYQNCCNSCDNKFFPKEVTLQMRRHSLSLYPLTSGLIKVWMLCSPSNSLPWQWWMLEIWLSDQLIILLEQQHQPAIHKLLYGQQGKPAIYKLLFSRQHQPAIHKSLVQKHQFIHWWVK